MADDTRKTPVFDWEAGEFLTDFQGGVVTATEGKAAEQVILKAQATPRGMYLIYGDLDNPELNHKYGSDVIDIAVRQDLSKEVRESEIKRAIKEALVYDAWVTDIGEITLYQAVDTDGVLKDFATFTVSTIYDEEIEVKGVAING